MLDLEDEFRKFRIQVGKSQDTFVQFREIREIRPENVFYRIRSAARYLISGNQDIFGHFFPEMSQILKKCKKMQKNAKCKVSRKLQKFWCYRK
jgi:hypothetical protein